jgi:predicted RNA-binding protein with PIN domain
MYMMKKTIIDGHNLIPKLPGIHLADVDDEERLISIIQEYCRLARMQAELFFDGAPIPGSHHRKSGLVHVHFIREGRTADSAMIDLLRKVGRNSKGFRVASSDRRIQAEARALGCEVVTSEAFAAELRSVLSSETAVAQKRDKALTPIEVEDWLQEFGEGTLKNPNS